LTAKKKKVEHCYHLITKGLRMVSLRWRARFGRETKFQE
jgi:hypothetical protein